MVKRLAKRILPMEGAHFDLRDKPDWPDDLLACILGAEVVWLRKRNLPFELSVVVANRKEQRF